MNILITVNQLTRAFGGVTTHILDLCKYLVKEGNKVFIASNGGEYVEQFEALGIKHYKVSFVGIQKNPVKLYDAYKAVKNIVEENEIDLIHNHSQPAIAVSALIKMSEGVPYIWTSHVDEIPGEKILRLMHKTLKFPVIAVSLDMKKHLVQNVGMIENCITSIPNGVELSLYSELSDEEKEKFKKGFEIKDDDYVISLLSRVVEVKGHQLLLDAISELQKENALNGKKVKILFAGNATDQKYLDDRIAFAKENNIDLKYIGFQRPRDVFGVSDLSVLPSYKEGFGIVCAESFLMKCPVIRADTPGFSDMDDVCLVFEKGNVQEFKEKLKKVINDVEETKKMTDKAYNKALDKFVVEKMGEATFKVYESLKTKK